MGCCDRPISGPMLPREAIIERRNACRVCEHSTRNPDRRFQATNGFTTRSICRLSGANLCAATKCPTCDCPARPSKWPAGAALPVENPSLTVP